MHESDPPDPWANYRRCLSDIPECTHLLIVQDDMIACRNAVAGIEAIAQRHPHDPVCLFLGALPAASATHARRAMQRGERYVSVMVGSFMPIPAVLWPVGKAREFLAWTTTARGMTRADDGNAAKWLRQTGTRVWASVPSLFQHDDEQPSVKGGRTHKPWTECWRFAIFLAEDALDYDW